MARTGSRCEGCGARTLRELCFRCEKTGAFGEQTPRLQARPTVRDTAGIEKLSDVTLITRLKSAVDGEGESPEEAAEVFRRFRDAQRVMPAPVNGVEEPLPVQAQIAAEINGRTYERRMERLRAARREGRVLSRPMGPSAVALVSDAVVRRDDRS